MKRLTLVLLVDALRADYSARMPYLRALASESRTGRLREDFGFVPRAAYFGGLTPSQYRLTNMFCRDPERSPFRIAGYLPSSRFGRLVEDPLGLRAFLESQARERTTAFGRQYLSTFDIPLSLLPQFALAETEAAWSSRAGYPTIFDHVRAGGGSVFTCAWPDTNMLDDPSDRGIVTAALAGIQPPCRLAFVHIGDLDRVGHAHGPESRELDRALHESDGLIKLLITTLEERFDAVDIVLFGDHGMLPVKKTVDLGSALAQVNAEVGRDYVFFLDSSMARFWFPSPHARPLVEAALQGLAGRVLDDETLAALDLADGDPRNAELIFLADPGAVIHPSFFQRSGDPVKGMHGYHPDCPDNQGFFLVREAGTRQPGALGVVPAQAVFHHAMALLDADRSVPAASHRGVFTQHPDPKADAMVARHMADAVSAIREALPRVEAIVLCGSFGRGEGGVADDRGLLKPVNDYDLLVLAPEDDEADLTTLGRALARRFNLDFVHISRWHHVNPWRPISLADFDLRWGHRVLWGNSAALDELPRYVAADLPAIEGVHLLLNRMAGILTGLRGPFMCPDRLDAQQSRYLQTQVMKALMAIGDWHLIRTRQYACSYATRLDRITWMARDLGLAGDRLSAIQDAYRFKLHPSFDVVHDIVSLAGRTSDWLLETFVEAMRSMTREPVADLRAATRRYYAIAAGDAGHVAVDNEWCSEALAVEGSIEARPDCQVSIRASMYAALPLLLASANGHVSSFRQAMTDLDECLTAEWPITLTPEHWNRARAQAAGAWLALVT